MLRGIETWLDAVKRTNRAAEALAEVLDDEEEGLDDLVAHALASDDPRDRRLAARRLSRLAGLLLQLAAAETVQATTALRERIQPGGRREARPGHDPDPPDRLLRRVAELGEATLDGLADDLGMLSAQVELLLLAHQAWGYVDFHQHRGHVRGAVRLTDKGRQRLEQPS